MDAYPFPVFGHVYRLFQVPKGLKHGVKVETGLISPRESYERTSFHISKFLFVCSQR